LKRLIDMPRGGWILSCVALSGIGVFIFAVAILMGPYAEAVGDRRNELMCLQVAFTPARAAAVVQSFSPEAQQAIAALLVPGDVVFAFFYGLLLAGLVGLLARCLDGAWRRAGTIAMWFPLIASCFDVIEDLFLQVVVLQLINAPDATVSPMLTTFAGLAATAKYIALCGLTPAYSIGGIVRGIRTNRRISAWIVYVLVILVVVSICMPVVQQMPKCF